MLPEDAPVRLTSAELEELDYTKLYGAYSPKGRKSAADPRALFKVMVYGYQCGIYSSRKLEEACKYRIDFMWLLENERAPDHSTFARFRTGRCQEAAEELFCQYVLRLEEKEESDHSAVFIDGTKLESKAGRYTFVWKKTISKYRDRVRAELKKLSGLETKLQVRAYLENTAESIDFVHGKGKRKSPEQREWEKLIELLDRWEKYDQQLAIIGSDRNSCSKTDHDATFMRMKDDHMRNGQLKPGYNVQLAVNSEYITGVEVYSDRTDSRTLKPFLNVLRRKHGKRYKEIVADAGYESLENYLYLEKNNHQSYIKPSNYDRSKQKAFKRQIGRFENMAYNAEDDCYICAEGRKLVLRTELFLLCLAYNLEKLWNKRMQNRLKTRVSRKLIA